MKKSMTYNIQVEQKAELTRSGNHQARTVIVRGTNQAMAAAIAKQHGAPEGVGLDFWWDGDVPVAQVYWTEPANMALFKALGGDEPDTYHHDGHDEDRAAERRQMGLCNQ